MTFMIKKMYKIYSNFDPAKIVPPLFGGERATPFGRYSFTPSIHNSGNKTQARKNESFDSFFFFLNQCIFD